MVLSLLLAVALGWPTMARDAAAAKQACVSHISGEGGSVSKSRLHETQVWECPSNVLALAADVAGVVPHARPAAIGLALVAIMTRFPSQNPMRDGQLAMGRGGRRG